MKKARQNAIPEVEAFDAIGRQANVAAIDFLAALRAREEGVAIATFAAQAAHPKAVAKKIALMVGADPEVVGLLQRELQARITRDALRHDAEVAKMEAWAALRRFGV